MRPANSELEKEILMKTLNLLQEKEPVEVGMRDVAVACGISATAIYRYYKDKNALFQKISIHCLSLLEDKIKERVLPLEDSRKRVIEALRAYRDWCFENPRIALVVFSKFTEDISEGDIQKFYGCNRLGKMLFEKCMEEGVAFSDDVSLDVGILISGLWGCIESVILERTEPEYWNRGVEFTDRFIEILCHSFFKGK